MIEKALSNHGTLVNISWWNALNRLLISKKLSSVHLFNYKGLVKLRGRGKITQVAGI